MRGCGLGKSRGAVCAKGRTATRTATAALARLVPLIVVLALVLALGGCRSQQGEGFAIYLVTGGVSPAETPALSQLKLADAPILTAAGIVSYSRDTHEIELMPAAYSALRYLGGPLTGLAFAVCVDHRPIYTGRFMTPIWSGTFDGVVILEPIGPEISLDRYSVRLDLGYPGPDWFKGQDPRSDPAILRALEKAGKLK
jgi:hypothetical protein